MKKDDVQKTNGQFYTPPALAKTVAGLGIDTADSSVLDPCFGEGALLFAASERLRELGSPSRGKQLFGYDLEITKGRTALAERGVLLPKHALVQADFFSLMEKDSKNRFDVVLMNPPFVRHHRMSKDDQARIRVSTGVDVAIPHTADLWVYFLIHSLRFLRSGGQLAAILPWSFLHADYARPVRKYLSQQFRELHVYVVGKRVFQGAEERVLIILGIGLGSGMCQVAMHYSEDVPRLPAELVPVPYDEWINSPQHAFVPLETVGLLHRLADRLGFRSLRQYAEIRIGTVTGANSFFTLSTQRALDLELPPEYLSPVIKHSSQLRRLSTSGLNGTSEVLLTIPPNAELSGPLVRYIESGRKLALHRRYHTGKRQPWYSVPVQKAADAFLPYMTKEVPFLVLNTRSFCNTNTIHRVDFLPSVTEEQRKGIQLSMLTSISQLSIELAARTYGGGVLKIEPSAAGSALVCLQSDFPKKLQSEVNKLLMAGRGLEAVSHVDNWLCTEVPIKKSEIDRVRAAYDSLRRLRLGGKRKAKDQ